MAGAIASVVGGLFGGGKKAAYTPVLASQSSTPATSSDPSVALASDAQRRLAGTSSGLGSTIKSSAGGAPSGPIQFKTLLGE